MAQHPPSLSFLSLLCFLLACHNIVAAFAPLPQKNKSFRKSTRTTSNDVGNRHCQRRFALRDNIEPTSSATTTEFDCDVLVAGAGPAGLVLAHALRNRGYSVKVCERRPKLAPVGAAVFLHPFALLSLRSVSRDLEENLRRASTQIRELKVNSIVDSDLDIGSDQFDLADERIGAPFVVVRFWDMLKALRQGLPDDIFCLGHAVERFEPLSKDGNKGVKVHFQSNNDGKDNQDTAPPPMRAKFLLDASGIRSCVRNQLTGQKPIPRLRATFAVAPAQGMVDCHGADFLNANGERKLSFLSGNGKSVTTASLQNGDVWWTQTDYSDDPTRSIPISDKESLQQRLDRRFADWPEHIQGLVAATPNEDIIECTIGELPVTWKWGAGYDVTLVGDAAHAQLPALGLGVSTAFADIDELCRQLDRHGLSRTALRWYEAVRIPQTIALQLASRLAYFANLYVGRKRDNAKDATEEMIEAEPESVSAVNDIEKKEVRELLLR